MSNCAICERAVPLTLVKLPTATSRSLAGLVEICRTLVRSPVYTVGSRCVPANRPVK